MHHKKQKSNPTSSEESSKTSHKTPSQDSHSDIEEMMKAIIDAEDIDYNDMAGGWIGEKNT